MTVVETGLRQPLRSEPISRSTRAELQFPLSRVDRFSRQRCITPELSSSTPDLAAILEYLTANILELAGNEAHSQGRRRITPEHVETVVENNHISITYFKKDAKSSDGEVPEPEKKQ
uniref:Histone H2A n=1 Tax=Castor canadensis TaxID=51338 RepID=A0A8B7TRB8_CASCN|nr:histone H2A-Bbd type 1-like [Castor canadensis]